MLLTYLAVDALFAVVALAWAGFKVAGRLRS